MDIKQQNNPISYDKVNYKEKILNEKEKAKARKIFNEKSNFFLCFTKITITFYFKSKKKMKINSF